MKTIKLLLVEDEKKVADIMKNLIENRAFFGFFFNVALAHNVLEANYQMETSQFDCVILDIDLGEDSMNGIKLAEIYKEKYPKTPRVLWTSKVEYYRKKFGDDLADDYLIKPALDVYAMILAILNVIWHKNMPTELRQKKEKYLESIIYFKKNLRFVGRSGNETGAERIDFITEDGKSVAAVVYDLPGQNEERKILCLQSTIGCVGRCKFCQSENRPISRVLTTEEILSQFIHMLDSYHTQRLFNTLNNLTINFSTEGDSIFSNLKNSCEAVRIIQNLKGINISTIMTTIGHVGNIRRLADEYGDLNIKLYISLNFIEEKLRGRFMPATKRTSLESLRDALQYYAKKTGIKSTISFIVIKGLNDKKEDAKKIFELFGDNTSFEIKLMALEPKSLRRFEAGDTVKFKNFLLEAGFNESTVRIREIVGGNIKAGCGTTVPVSL